MNINPKIGVDTTQSDLGKTLDSASKILGGATTSGPTITGNTRGYFGQKINNATSLASSVGTTASGLTSLAIGRTGEGVGVVMSGAKFVGEGGLKAAAAVGTMIPSAPGSEIIKPMSKYNTFYKVIILVLFFTVFIKVIINIFRFFGIDIIDIYSYLGWFVFLMIILIFIPHDYSTLKLN
jgi:hypothetical protein